MNKTKFKINTDKNIIKDLNFEDVDIKKSTDASDAAAVDEKGRFLIFRNVRGNVVPMHVSATDYAEHLAKNGINIDPADQNMLSDLEDQVSALADIGSQDPRYAAKLEQLLVKKIAMATGYQNQYQQQVGQTPEQNQQLKESAKQHEAAGTMQSRVDPSSDKGWGDYLDKYIADFGGNRDKNSREYKALLAYGAVLKEALYLSRAGKSGNSVSIPEIIKKLQSDYTNKEFVENIAKLTGEDEIDTRLRLAHGLRVLDAVIDDDNSSFGKGINENFNKVYNKMYSDFTEEKLSVGEFDRKDVGDLGKEEGGIPDELPSKITGQELHRVQKEFNNVVDKGGNVHQVANQVFDHLLKRLVDTFSSGTERYTQIALNSNLIEAARMAHKRGYQFAESAKDFQLHKDPSALVNSMLNEVDLAIKSGSDGAYVAAIKKLSTLLGELDGYKMHADNPRATPRNFNERWGDIMMGARRKSTGHASIESLLSSPEARSHAGIDNSILRLSSPQDPVSAVIKPKTPPPAKFDIEMPDEEAATTSTPRIESPKLEVNQFDKKIQTPDGKYQIRGNPETNTIDLLHEGEIVASHQRGNFPKVTDIFNKFNAEIENHVNSPKKTPQDMGETTVEPRNNFHEDYSSDEKGVISSPDGYTATKVTDEDGSEYLKLSNPTGNEITAVPFDGSSESEKVALSKLSDIRSQNNYPIKQSRISTSEEAMSRYGFSKLQKVQHALEQAGGVIKSAAGTAGFGANISFPNGEIVRMASQKGSSDIFVKVGKSPAKELNESGLEEYLKTVKPQDKEPEKPAAPQQTPPAEAKANPFAGKLSKEHGFKRNIGGGQWGSGEKAAYVTEDGRHGIYKGTDADGKDFYGLAAIEVNPKTGKRTIAGKFTRKIYASHLAKGEKLDVILQKFHDEEMGNPPKNNDNNLTPDEREYAVRNGGLRDDELSAPKNPENKPASNPLKINGRIIKPNEAPDPAEIARLTGMPAPTPKIPAAPAPTPKTPTTTTFTAPQNAQLGAETPKSPQKQIIQGKKLPIPDLTPPRKNTTGAVITPRVKNVYKPINTPEDTTTSPAKVTGTKLVMGDGKEFDFGTAEEAKRVLSSPDIVQGFRNIKAFLPSSGGIDIEVKDGKEMMFISAAEYKRAKTTPQKEQVIKDDAASKGIRLDSNTLNAIHHYIRLHYDATHPTGKFFDKPKTLPPMNIGENLPNL